MPERRARVRNAVAGAPAVPMIRAMYCWPTVAATLAQHLHFVASISVV
jgi:hypothetical protein